MTTQDEKALPTLQQRLEALAQRERKCPELGIILSFHSEMNWPCQQCGGSGKVPVLPGLRKPCPSEDCGSGRLTADDLPFGRLGDQHKGCLGRGWVLRGDPDTEDGRLLLFGALCKALRELGCRITFWEFGLGGLPRSAGLYPLNGGYVSSGGPTDLEALVDAVMKLKEGVPS